MSMIAATTSTRGTVTSADGTPIGVLVHRPATRVRGWFVWAHGGSWQRGSAATWSVATQRISAASSWAVVSVDYRLAPDHPFPAAVHDVLAALRWAETRAEGVPVAVGGDSAGGTIAACVALARRDTGGRTPAQVLAYPPLDPHCTAASYHEHPDAFPGSAALRRAWRLWLGTAPTPGSTGSSPWEAASLTGLAPVFLAVGDRDPVRDDVTGYADRLHADHVPVTVALLRSVGHGDLLAPHSRILPALVTGLTRLRTTRTEPNRTKGRHP